MNKNLEEQPTKVGYRIAEWCRAVGCSRPTYYNLKGELAPHTLRLNSIPIIIEPPGEYIARVAALQAKQSHAA